MTSERFTLKTLMDETLAGRTTTIKDLAKCDEWLLVRNVHIEKKQKNGMYLIYQEQNWRRSVSDYICSHISKMDFHGVLSGFKQNTLFVFNLYANDFINSFTKDINIIALNNFIGKYESDENVQLTDRSYTEIFFFICIAIQRIRKDKKLVRNDIQLEKNSFIDSRTVKWFTNNQNALNDLSPVTVPEEELGAILHYILGATKIYRNLQNIETDEMEKQLVRQFVDRVQQFLFVDLTQDEHLFENLIMHIRPAIHRIIYGMEIENPLKNEVKCLYPQIFKACQVGAECFILQFGKFPNEDEIAYLTMHIGASLEKIKQKKENKHFFKAIVVCFSGVGTSQLLYSRLLTEFPNLIIEGINSAEGLSQTNKSDIDLIISTVPLSMGIKESVIYVTPFLNDKDVVNISKFMRKSALSKDSNALIVDDLMSIVLQEAVISDYAKLHGRLSQYFSNREQERDPQLLPHILSFVKPELMEVNVSVNSCQEAIRHAGLLLLNGGYIEQSYIQSMINNKDILGANIVIAKSVAFPHAKSSDGVKRTGMAFITLEKPVYFGNAELDPVKLVIALAADERMTHLKALSELISLISHEKTIEQLCLCQSKEAFIQKMRVFYDGNHG